MSYFSLTGIENKRYSTAFIEGLFRVIEDFLIGGAVHIGLDNGYLGSLFISRSEFSYFNYLGVGRKEGLHFVLHEYPSFSFMEYNTVEAVQKIIEFVMKQTRNIVVVCEEVEYGPILYWPLGRTGDIFITPRDIPLFSRESFLVVDNWHFYRK